MLPFERHGRDGLPESKNIWWQQLNEILVNNVVRKE
jgi:hypothetical protein